MTLDPVASAEVDRWAACLDALRLRRRQEAEDQRLLDQARAMWQERKAAAK